MGTRVVISITLSAALVAVMVFALLEKGPRPVPLVKPERVTYALIGQIVIWPMAALVSWMLPRLGQAADFFSLPQTLTTLLCLAMVMAVVMIFLWICATEVTYMTLVLMLHIVTSLMLAAHYALTWLWPLPDFATQFLHATIALLVATVVSGSVIFAKR